MTHSEYKLYTVNAPIYGLDEDLRAFISDFVELGSFRFSDYADLWKKHKFLQLICGRNTQASLRDVLEGIFFYLVNNFTSTIPLIKVGSLYTIYAFYGKQPISKQARVNISPIKWKALCEFIKDVAENKHWDVYYIFHRLCVLSAFRFVANEEDLYPGVPLYTRSDISLPARRTFLTKSQRKLLTKFNKDENSPKKLAASSLPPRFADYPENLKDECNALFVAVNQYSEAKSKILKDSPSSEVGDEPSDGAEEGLLSALNLVNFNTSIAPIKKLLEDISRQTKDFVGEPSTAVDEETKEAEVDDIGARRRRLRNRKDWVAPSRKSPRKSLERPMNP